MKLQDVVERATYNLGFIIKHKIVDNAHATNAVRLAACEEARNLIGEQVASVSTRSAHPLSNHHP